MISSSFTFSFSYSSVSLVSNEIYTQKEKEMHLENTCLYLPSQVVGAYNNRMHRMMRQPPPPPPPPPQPSISTARSYPSRNSIRLLNDSIKPK